MSADLILSENEILVGEDLYAKAINIILASAQHELLIFDQDLCRGDFCSLLNSRLLEQFLSKNLNSRLTIVLQNTEAFKENCPRIVNLLYLFGHKMTIHETNQSVKHAKDCFVIADSKHYVKRIHIDQARFTYATSDAEKVVSLNIRFKEILDNTQSTVTIMNLGL
jgi:hypothetical protein